MRRAWYRLQVMRRRLLDGGAGDAELSEELRAFVEHDADSKIRSGMTPADARRAALIELGGARNKSRSVFGMPGQEPAGKASSGTSGTACAVSVRHGGSRSR